LPRSRDRAIGLRETQRARHSRGEALTVRRVGQSERLG
jgi:hypothetical protein